MLEVLHGPLVFFRRGTGTKSAQVAALAGACVFLSRVQSILAGCQFAYHDLGSNFDCDEIASPNE